MRSAPSAARAALSGVPSLLALLTAFLFAATALAEPVLANPSPAEPVLASPAPAKPVPSKPAPAKPVPGKPAAKSAPKKAPAPKPSATTAPHAPAASPASSPSPTPTRPKPDTLHPALKDSARAPADTLPKPLRDLGQKALKVPEKLLFDIIWGGWSFRWVTAGQATLELLPTERPETWKIRSLAWCNGFFRTFYPVRDTVVSLLDSRGIYPLRFEKHLHEGSYKASLSATYDQARHIVSTQDTSFSIEPFTHDVMSAFYFIRTQRLDEGDTLELAAVSGKKKYNLKVLCHGRETITVAAGTFKTLVVEPVLKEDGLFKAKGKLTIWVTDDEAHVPVKMESKIPVGSIKAELVSRS